MSIRFNLIALMCLTCSMTLVAQNYFIPVEYDINKNFYELQEEMRERIAKGEDGARTAKHWGRLESFLEPRVYPHGDINKYQMKTRKAVERFFEHTHANSRSPHGDWQFLGPESSPDGNRYGRCLEIKFHPTDPSTLYILTSSAGLWKSTDNGNTWENLTEHLPLLYAVDFVIDPNDPDIIYMITGNDKQTNGGLMYTRSFQKTTNGGATWFRTAFEFEGDNFPFRLVMHPDPDSSDVMYVATLQGIHRTEDGWETATHVLNLPAGLIARDIEFKPGDPSVMYASGNKRMWKSTSRGTEGTWNQILDSDFAGLDTMDRIEIAVTDLDPNLIYAIASDNQHDYFFRSQMSGNDSSWVTRLDTNGWVNQAAYDLDIVVDPDDANTVYVGHVLFYKSTDAGMNWEAKSTTHADHHRLKFKNGTLYDLNDGGAATSTDKGDSWDIITAGIHVHETYDIAGTPQDPDQIYVGSQDCGGNRIAPGGEFQKVCSACTGDVIMCLQDPTDLDKSYMAAQGGGLRFTTDGWSSSGDAGPGDANYEPEFGDGIWLCPYELDTRNPDFIYTGKDSMWRLNVDAQTFQWLGYPGSGKTRAIAQGVNDSNKMYIVHGGQLYSTDSARTTSASGATWTLLTNDFMVGSALRNVAVNPVNASEVYIVYSGNEAGNKVFFNDSAGTTGFWQNISGSLPNVPVIDITVHDNGYGNHAVYIGTDIGVFYRDDSLGDWIYFSNGLPSSPVMELYINNTSGEIIAGTLGRGVWKSDVYGGCPSFIHLTPGSVTAGTRYYAASNEVISSVDYDDTDYTNINYKAAESIELLPGFHMKLPGLFRARLGGCPDQID